MAMAKKTSKKKVKPKVNKNEAAERVRNILPVLKKIYPGARTELKHSKPLELLIATILSAQCTDVRVNMVTKELFKNYKSAKDWAEAPIGQIEQDIKTTGFFRNKAKNIKAASQKILSDFGGEVPGTMEELTSLPGVGRKTANVILSNAFAVPGIACDTHVIRLSRRLRLSGNSDPVKLEFDLAEIVPKKDWSIFSHALILHGRNICKARKPNCADCPIRQYCPSADRPELW